MGNRHELLGRILRVATNPKFDGVIGTTDIIEDLLIVDQLLVEKGRTQLLSVPTLGSKSSR